MPHIDLTFQQTIHEVELAVLFHCPYCKQPVTEAQRLRSPPSVVHLFAPVYRCKCSKHFGCPIALEPETEEHEPRLDNST